MRPLGAILVLLMSLPGPASATTPGTSFRDDFDQFDAARWFPSHDWLNGDWQNCTWSKAATGVAEGRLFLHFLPEPMGARQNTCAEVQTRTRFHYGTYEARIRTDAASGINAAFFTYIGPQQERPHDEIDFEVLAKDTSKVTMTSWVDGKPHSGGEVAVPGGTDGDFNDYAFVWEPDRLSWYLNGAHVKTLEGAAVPREPQKIFFSHWGTDTLSDWLGPFTDPGRTLVMEVDWFAYTRLGDACQFPESVACSLD